MMLYTRRRKNSSRRTPGNSRHEHRGNNSKSKSKSKSCRRKWNKRCRINPAYAVAAVFGSVSAWTYYLYVMMIAQEELLHHPKIIVLDNQSYQRSSSNSSSRSNITRARARAHTNTDTHTDTHQHDVTPKIAHAQVTMTNNPKKHVDADADADADADVIKNSKPRKHSDDTVDDDTGDKDVFDDDDAIVDVDHAPNVDDGDTSVVDGAVDGADADADVGAVDGADADTDTDADADGAVDGAVDGDGDGANAVDVDVDGAVNGVVDGVVDGTDTNGADANGADANGADANGADANGADANGADANGADANGADPNVDPNGADPNVDAGVDVIKTEGENKPDLLPTATQVIKFTPETTKPKIVVKHDEEPRPVAVVQIGPYKTGSSAIQWHVYNLGRFLHYDGYTNPRFPGFHKRNKNWGNLANCLRNETASAAGCDPENKKLVMNAWDEFLRKYGRPKKYEPSKKVVFASEIFSDVNIDIAELQKLLGSNTTNPYYKDGFDVHIVIVYRHLFDWIVSLHNELFKLSIMRKRTRFLPLVDWLTYHWDDVEEQIQNHPHNVFMRYKNHFPYITMLDYHSYRNVYDKDDNRTSLEEAFFCDAVPNATRTCEEIRKGRHKKAPRNPSAEFYGSDLMSALETNYSACLGRVDFNEKVEEKMEEYLRKGRRHEGRLPWSCPPKSVIDRLWSLSWNYRRALVKEGVLEPCPKEPVRNEFIKKFRERAFCSFNPKSMIRRWETMDWFKKLTKNGSCTGLQEDKS